MRPSHSETTSKQEAHKLKASIIGLFNPKYEMCLMVTPSYTRICVNLEVGTATINVKSVYCGKLWLLNDNLPSLGQGRG